MDTMKEPLKPVLSAVPCDGYIETSPGRYVLETALTARQRMEHQTVNELIQEARELQGLISLFKAKAFDKVDQLRQTLAAQYNVDLAGKRGGMTLTSLGDRRRVQVSVGDTMTFGPELEAAKALIDQCLIDWTNGGNQNLAVVVNAAFHVGENKRVRMDRVMSLRQLKIENDDRWDRAMLAIGDAVRTERSKMYIRFYERPSAEAELELIVLDFARVP